MLNLRSTFLCVVLLAFACSHSACASTCDAINADEVIKLEDARYAAQMANDFSAMEKLIADDLVYIHSSSVVDSKQSYIESMRSGMVKYKVMRRSDVKVRTFGCIATITGLGNFDVQLNDKDISIELRFHSIWAKRDGKIQFVSWQATRTPPKQ